MKVGDQLEVTSGAFTGFTATVTAIARNRIDVEVEMFGRRVPLQLMPDQLRPPDYSLARLEREVVNAVGSREHAMEVLQFWRNQAERKMHRRNPEERAAAWASHLEQLEAARHAKQVAALARFRASFAELEDAARAMTWRAEEKTWTAQPDVGPYPDDEKTDRAKLLREETERWQRKALLAAASEDEPRNEQLEQQIERDVAGDAGFLVYGDWLQTQGHPRGELVAMSAAGVTEAMLLQRRLARRLLGPLAGFADSLAVRWRLGFVDAIRLEATRDDEDRGIDIGQLVAAALRTPSCRFVRDLEIALPSVHETVDLHATLATAGPRPALRRLALVTNTEEEMLSWTGAGELAGLAALYPNLEVLEVTAGSYTLAAPRFQRLQRLVLRTCGGGREHIAAVAGADWPHLAELEMWFGSRAYAIELAVDDFAPLLASRRMPALRALGLCNCELTDELCAAIVASPLLPQLTSLALAKGTMSEIGARTLIDNAARLRHLTAIDVDDNYLDDEVLAELRDALPQVASDDQRTSDEYADHADRYASVGE